MKGIKIHKHLSCIGFYSFLFTILLFQGSCRSQEILDPDNTLQNRIKSQLDSSIRHGVLPNGFTYFIKDISEPQSSLYLRLYHKAGSNQEGSDQIDIAHGLEHLAFKATKHFPNGIGQSEAIKKAKLSKYDLLAYSGLSTEYSFDAPPKNKEAMETAFLFFKDIIGGGLSLKDEDIASVKGELRQEFLFGTVDNLNEQNANSKLMASLFPCQQEELNYLNQLENQSLEAFKRFYRDWYRPDLFAISIVGNIDDVNGLEKSVISVFSKLKPAKELKQIINCDSLFARRPPQFTVIERTPDKNQMFPDTKENIDVIFRDPLTMENLDNFSGIQRLMLMQLLRQKASERFTNIGAELNASTLGIHDTYNLDNLPSTLKIGLRLENLVPEKLALQKMLHALKQLQVYGVSNQEWEEMKQRNLQYLKLKDRSNAEYWINEIKNYYVRGEAFPENKDILIKEWLSLLSLSEFNEFLSQFLSRKPEDIGIIAPSGHSALAYSEKQVRSWVDEAYQKKIDTYEKPTPPESFMSAIDVENLEKPKIISSSSLKEGVEEITLNNGIKIVYKQMEADSTLNQDKIRIHGFALKGSNSFPPEQFFSAVNAPNIINYSGVNGMNRFEIKKILEQYQLTTGVHTYIDRNEVGIQADATLDNLEIMLQLIYLHFSGLNENDKDFQNWKMMISNSYKYKPMLEFRNLIRDSTGDLAVTRYFFGRKSLNEGKENFNGIEKINLNHAYHIYNSLFGDAGDFTFVISGYPELNSFLPLLVKYLGNLPTSSFVSEGASSFHKMDTIHSKPLKFVEIPMVDDEKLNYMKYHLIYLENAQVPLDLKEQIKMEALGWITTEKAFRLRFEMGLELYDVQVYGTFNKDLNRYEISSTFKCVPEEYPIIRKEIQKIVSEMKSGQITQELFEQGMYAMHFYYDLDKSGGSMNSEHQNLYEHYRYGQPLLDPKEVELFVNSLTKEDIVETANKYFKEENLSEFVMRNNDLK